MRAHIHTCLSAWVVMFSKLQYIPELVHEWAPIIKLVAFELARQKANRQSIFPFALVAVCKILWLWTAANVQIDSPRPLCGQLKCKQLYVREHRAKSGGFVGVWENQRFTQWHAANNTSLPIAMWREKHPLRPECWLERRFDGFVLFCK